MTPFSATLGEYALFFAMLTCLAIVVVALVYLFHRNAGLLRFVGICHGLLAALLTVSAGALLTALLTDNFALAYVEHYSEKALPPGYKVAAFWAGQEGSLLLWAWVLGIMGMLMAWGLRKSEDAFAAVSLGIMALATGFFTLVMLFPGDPFTPAREHLANGMGLNPALQNLAMVFHPPMLFLGYAGYTAPFALLLGALCTGQRDGRWLHLARPWMVFSWITLTVGIVLGAQWAYVDLGFGGYWKWDPVENASLLPWLTGTALLHSAVLQARRGIFKRWTASLTAASFFLCILGTYLTRSGVISSVHAFNESPIGSYFLIFLGVILAVSILVIALRLKDMRAERPLEDIVSREGFFLIGNVLLVVMTVTTVVGTLFPLISGFIGIGTVTAKEPFYNNVVLPMALILAGLMATGPILGSGAGALDRARTKLGGMLIAGAATAGVVFLLGYTSLWGLAAAAVVGAVAAGVAIDLCATFKPRPANDAGASPSAAQNSGMAGAATRAFTQRHRHWGAQLAHLGLAAIVAGIAGSQLYGQSKTFQLHPGADGATKAQRTIGGYTLDLGGYQGVRPPKANYQTRIATITLTRASGEKFQLKPELRTYDQNPDETATEVALRLGILSDVYVTLAGAEPDGSTVTVTAMINPLVNWIWIGGALLTLGGLICLIPGKQDAPALAVSVKETVRPEVLFKGMTKRQRQRALAFKKDAFINGRQGT